jgi:hypothetical protein
MTAKSTRMITRIPRFEVKKLIVLSMAAALACASSGVGPRLSIGSPQGLQNGFLTSTVYDSPKGPPVDLTSWRLAK